jgi:hypothetical protein
LVEASQLQPYRTNRWPPQGPAFTAQLLHHVRGRHLDVSISKLGKWFEVPRRTVYYRPTKAEPKIQERLLTPIKAMIEENPSFG